MPDQLLSHKEENIRNKYSIRMHHHDDEERAGGARHKFSSLHA